MTSKLMISSLPWHRAKDSRNQSARGMAVSSPTVALIFQALRDELTRRGERIVSEIRRVLDGAFIEDFDKLVDAVKAELVARLEACTSIAQKYLRKGSPVFIGLSKAGSNSTP